MSRDRGDVPSYLRALLAGGWTFSPGKLVVAEVRHDDNPMMVINLLMVRSHAAM